MGQLHVSGALLDQFRDVTRAVCETAVCHQISVRVDQVSFMFQGATGSAVGCSQNYVGAVSIFLELCVPEILPRLNIYLFLGTVSVLDALCSHARSWMCVSFICLHAEFAFGYDVTSRRRSLKMLVRAKRVYLQNILLFFSGNGTEHNR